MGNGVWVGVGVEVGVLVVKATLDTELNENGCWLMPSKAAVQDPINHTISSEKIISGTVSFINSVPQQI